MRRNSLQTWFTIAAASTAAGCLPPSAAQDFSAGDAGMDDAGMDVTGMDATGMDATGMDVTGIDDAGTDDLSNAPVDDAGMNAPDVALDDAGTEPDVQHPALSPAGGQSIPESDRQDYYWCIDSLIYKSSERAVIQEAMMRVTPQLKGYTGLNFRASPDDCSASGRGIGITGKNDGARGSYNAAGFFMPMVELRIWDNPLTGFNERTCTTCLYQDNEPYSDRIDGILLHELMHALGFGHDAAGHTYEHDTYSTLHYPSASDFWGGNAPGADWEHHRRLSFSDIGWLDILYPGVNTYNNSVMGPFSEEGPTQMCDPGQIMTGIECFGDYCDNKNILCATARGLGNYEYPGKDYTLVNQLAGNYTYSPGWASTGRWANGLSCQGGWCESVKIHSTQLRASYSDYITPNNNSCYYTGWFSEEHENSEIDEAAQNFQVCRKNHAVAAIACEGSYCDNLNLKCCELKRPTAFSDHFNGSIGPAVWTTVNDGVTDGSSDWNATSGAAVETGNAYDYDQDETYIRKKGTYIKAHNTSFTEFELATNVYSGDDDGYGVMFGITSPDFYFRFSVDYQRSFARLVRVENDVFTMIWEDLDFTPPMNQWNIIRVAQAAGDISISFNDTELVSNRPLTPNTGSIGLYAFGNDDVRFDWVEVYD